MSKDFRLWFELKPKINEIELLPDFHIHEGEIWWCSLGENVGIETNGKGDFSLRPVLILKVFNKEHLWIVPLTKNLSVDKFHIPIASFSQNSLVVVSQLRTVSSRRLYRLIQKINDKDLYVVKKALSSLLYKYETPPDGGESHGPFRSNNGQSIAGTSEQSIDNVGELYDNKQMSNEEKEVKFIDIDVVKIEQKLKEIGATRVGEYFYRRWTFDFPGFPLNAKGAWVRLRDEGDKVVLTWKQRLGIMSHDGSTSDTGMEEIEIIVSDFEKTALMLRRIGMIDKFYQENKRIRWTKRDVEFDIDMWPAIKPYLEIEAKSWEEIDSAIVMLGLNSADKKIFSTGQIFAMNGIRELDYIKMTFEGLVKRSPEQIAQNK